MSSFGSLLLRSFLIACFGWRQGALRFRFSQELSDERARIWLAAEMYCYCTVCICGSLVRAAPGLFC